MRRLLAWTAFAGSLSLLLLTSGCPGTGGTRRDGGTEELDGSDPTIDGGGVVNTACGPAGGRCCAGRTCELGLRCSRDVCCVQAGSTTRCGSASDCCTGLTCSMGLCCTPRGSTCTGSADCCSGLVCADGVCASPETDLPGMEGCGGAGGVCCTGFTCRSGLVCSGGRCGACGDEGQACCDGATPCSSTSLVCNRTTCVAIPDPEDACGTIDRPACGMDGTPVTGGDCAGAVCEGDLRCVGGMCLNPMDEGGMDQPCGPRGGCDGGLICDYSGPTPTCEMTPEGCGRDMQMCCDTGGTGGSCEGALNCQFGDCSTCRGPSLSCVLGGLLPGNECCNGSVCRPAPLVPRCCVGAGEECTNSADCCGFMQCQSGMCQAGRDGSFCLDSSECGEGFTCETFFCRPDEGMMMCIEARASCSGSGMCCDGLTCSSHRDPDAPVEPPPDACCAAASTSCTDSEDCCGRMLCTDGECGCVSMDMECDADADCCEGLGCVSGYCTDTSSCSEENERCMEGMDTCCDRLSCRPDTFGATQRDCCSTEACRTDEQCCGEMRCTEGRCRARVPGESCADDLDCEGAFFCIDGTCGSFT